MKIVNSLKQRSQKTSNEKSKPSTSERNKERTSQVLTARYVPLTRIFPIALIELRRSLELGPDMLERNSADHWSELDEIKQENKKWAELDNLLTLRKLWRNVF